ncbi:MAG: GNAT family N-acetyltransferase [Cytophagales bacterium]|nr:GNAT family N-acetyltransferase [Armatimonadota bacterium]
MLTGQIVATAQATHAPTERHPEGGEIGWVAAHPEHRGKGLGRAVSALTQLGGWARRATAISIFPRTTSGPGDHDLSGAGQQPEPVPGRYDGALAACPSAPARRTTPRRRRTNNGVSMNCLHNRLHCLLGGITASLLLGISTASCRAQSQTAPAAGPVAAPVSGWWSFEPAKDTFSPAALLDLRSLNEKTAGENGFITRSADGADFATTNGKPIRFWGVSEYIQDKDNPDWLAHKARWLAKRGVNMVRVHTQIASKEADSELTDVDPKAVDRIWRLVAAMKKEGIYTTISPYWGVHVKAQPKWNIPGMSGQELAGVVFWDKTLQTGYKSWLKALYGPANPYTGIPLSQEPAVAILQHQNEDSMLFWTMQGVKGEQLTQVRARFGDWLKKKHGSLAAANASWGGQSPAPGEFQDNQGDEFAQGRAGIYILWNWTQERSGYQGKRLADQLAFFGDTMKDFNAEIARYLRRDLGCRQLINAGNWRPADPVKLFDVERYSYTANEVMGVNRYFTGAHEGKDNGWAIRPGDKFTNNSVLRDPRGMPTNIKQPAGFPFLIPETEWVAPTAYQSEGPLLTAAYQSLTGVDVSYFFADGDVPEWQPPFAPDPWNPPTGKWSVATPMQVGQFPAAALLFRQGYVKKGAPVVHEERSLEDLWQRRSPLIAEEGGWDPNRDTGNLPPRSAVKTAADPLAFLVGPVEVVLGGDPSKNRVTDLAPYHNARKKTVESVTGEIRLNYGTGFCVVNSPKAQGATGFFRGVGGPVTLGDVTLESRNEYASVAVVALDDQPIKTSKKLLVQVGTIARPTGWQDKDATWASGDGKQTMTGKEVVSTGKNPWSIVRADLTVTVRNPGLTVATMLDANGEAVRRLPLTRISGGIRLTYPADTLYVVLQ